MLSINLNTAKPTINTFTDAANTLVENFAKSRPIHANSLLVSIYGDTVCPHGDTIWLGSLIKLVAPLGINQRLVRTSVFRLSEKNILVSKQVGRRSYYALTDRAYRQFLSASKRIYTANTQPWDQQWRLVMTSLNKRSTEPREALRKELYWLGFSRLTAGVYAHPMADVTEVQRIVKELKLEQHIAILTASAADLTQVPVTNALIGDCFDLEKSEQDYQLLIDDFQGIYEAVQHEKSPDPMLCFLVRTLLIHRFRHILLKEPELPEALVLAQSASYRARGLVKQLYRLVSSNADKYFTRVSETEGGNFQAPQDDYYRRFV